MQTHSAKKEGLDRNVCRMERRLHSMPSASRCGLSAPENTETNSFQKLAPFATDHACGIQTIWLALTHPPCFWWRAVAFVYNKSCPRSNAVLTSHDISGVF